MQNNAPFVYEGGGALAPGVVYRLARRANMDRLRKNKINIAKCTKISIFRRGGCPHPPVERLIYSTFRVTGDGRAMRAPTRFVQFSSCRSVFAQFEARPLQSFFTSNRRRCEE